VVLSVPREVGWTNENSDELMKGLSVVRIAARRSSPG
jgi:hypothetical protein